MDSTNSEKILEQLNKSLQDSKDYLQDLLNHPAAKDENHELHSTYVGWINTTKGSIKAQEQVINAIESQRMAYAEEALEEIQDIQYEVAGHEEDFNDSIKEFEDTLLDAEDTVKDAESFTIEKALDMAFKRYDELNQAEKLEKDTEEAVKDIETYMEEIPSKDTLSKVLAEKEHIAEEILKQNPSAYAKYQINEAKKAVADVKDAVNMTRECYKNAIKACYDLTKIKVNETISPIISSTLATCTQVLNQSAVIYNSAMDKSAKLIHKAADMVNQARYKCTRFMDKFIDLITLGAYSKIMPKIEKYNESHMSKTGVSIHNAINEFSRGTKDIDAYWKEIHDDGFIWGKDKAVTKRDNDGASVSVVKDIDSPAGAFSKAFANFEDWAKKEITETKQDFIAFAVSIKADIHEIKADICEKIADFGEKYARRIESKITQLHNADKAIFETNNQLRQIIHKMTEITPYEKQPYKPSPEIQMQIDLLKDSLQYPAIKAAYETLMVQVEKEEHLWNKQEAKNALQHDKVNDKLMAEYTKAYSTLLKNKDKIQENQEKIKKSKEKMEKVLMKVSTWNQSVKENREEAQALRDSVQERDL